MPDPDTTRTDGSAPVDAALLFATPGYAEAMPQLLDAAAATLGTRNIVGATAHGVLGEGDEVEGGPGLVIAALGTRVT